MSGILEFLQSDLGKMLIAAILGFIFGGKNPAWVNWILELLKLQKKTEPVVVQSQGFTEEDMVEELLGHELSSAMLLAQHFGEQGDLKGFEAAKACINSIIDQDLKGYEKKEWKNKVVVPTPV